MKFALATVVALLTLGSVQTQNVRYPADNRAVSYIASVGVGSPPKYYDLIIDTGSSNTWIGANRTRPYVKTSTSYETRDAVQEKKIRVEYGSGSFSGKEYLDQVMLGSELVLKNQSIGVATEAEGFDNVDGILGLGPAELTKGTLSPDHGDTIPTVADTMFTQKRIGAQVFGISFEPITSSNGTQMNGEISFGGVDDSKYTGKITYTPITSTSPANNFWGIDASATYSTGPGHGTTILSLTAGIVDSGTTLLLIATDAYKKFQDATGAVPDQATSLLSLTSDQFANMQSLFFHIGGESFEMTPNALIWPRSLNTHIGGKADGIYLIVQDLGSPSGAGLDFILGQVFMERIYTVHDIAKKEMGFAETPHTHDTTN
ncbi:hypothetical protein BGZ75_009060 [Mortierella antarctica]|nr:hypothetical protein BGZ75_009060 [Mortierella antarctica]